MSALDKDQSAALTPQTKYLHDYKAPPYWIKATRLEFMLEAGETLVKQTTQFSRNKQQQAGQELVLDGKELELISVDVDGQTLSADDYSLNDKSLILRRLPDEFTLTIVNKIKPEENTALEGLYQSNGMYCTQCEAEGFRRITYFLDRPDVMATYEVYIEADKAHYPVLLSNGNEIKSGDVGGSRHYVEWHDPHPKPSYLFALVAGDLQHIEDHFTTQSGREVTLRLFVEPQDLDKCDHGMESLIKSMKWDEEVYNLEYDLDIFNIVT